MSQQVPQEELLADLAVIAAEHGESLTQEEVDTALTVAGIEGASVFPGNRSTADCESDR